MSRFSKVILIAAVVTMVGAGAVMAQTDDPRNQAGHGRAPPMATTSWSRWPTARRRQFDVQEGFMFDIDGVPTAVGDLKPGTG